MWIRGGGEKNEVVKRREIIRSINISIIVEVISVD